MNTYKVGEGGWGNNIEFFPSWKADSDEQKVCGWKSNRPKVGDRLTVKMQSGKTLVFEFYDVEYMSDPPDMFFGKVKSLGYEDELPK